MKNYYQLNFLDKPLDENYRWPDHEFSPRAWYYWQFYNETLKEVIHPDLLAWSQQHDLNLNGVHLFCAPPRTRQGIHIDGNGEPPLFAINWILTATQSSMTWHRSLIQKVTEGHIDHAYHSWQEHECEEIERFSNISGPVLVNAQVPHRVINDTDEWRYCVSVRFPGSFHTWEQCVEFFMPYITVAGNTPLS